MAVSNYFNRPVWSHDGNILFGLSKYPKIQIDGYPAYWDLENGKYSRCKTDLAPYRQIQDAGNPDNPLEVLLADSGDIQLFDLGSCEVIRTLVSHGPQTEFNDYFMIAGFSYNHSAEIMIVGLADNLYNMEYKIVAHDLDTNEEVLLAFGVEPALSPDG